MIVNDKVYFVRNGAKPVFSKNGDNFTENSNDIVFSFGAEFYFVIGGGGEIRVNLSEICRRIQGLFNGGCKR